MSKSPINPPALLNAVLLSPTPHPQLSRQSSHGEIQIDSGINSSAAWTESLSSPGSEGIRLSLTANISTLSDDGSEELEDTDKADAFERENGRQARALFDFAGKPEFRELTNVEAGDELEILREEVGEGWSLAKLVAKGSQNESEHRGEMGLLPRTYYAFTAEFAEAPDLKLSLLNSKGRRERSTSSITPRGSPKGQPAALPLVPQTTGEWFPSFRKSLLGRKSFNRFSNFVTSGAEEWVLGGSLSERPDTMIHPPRHFRDTSAISITDTSIRFGVLGESEANEHYVDVGPAWRVKVPPFRVLVHSPSKRTSMLSGAYTVYTITSLFEPSDSALDTELNADPSAPPLSITVRRRFSHFVVLHTALTRRLPGLALPPLPEKQYAGRFNADFVEARRGDLARYLNRVVRHPVARYAEVLTFFLSCESEVEWKKQLPEYLALPSAGSTFYAHIFHPDFNLDVEDATDVANRFVSHVDSVSNGVQGLRSIFGQVRQARIEMSKAERLLSYSLLSLITAKPLASTPMAGISDENEHDTDKGKGSVNSEGAWCWRESCEDCLKLTKAMQKTSETLQSVADLYDNHARQRLLATHEALKDVAHPSALYANVVETHKSTLSRYAEATQEGSEDEEMAARCETVLNTTMAEMDNYHTQKVEDFENITKDHLDSEIIFYEQVLARLKASREAFNSPQYEQGAHTPRQPCIYERELENPRLNPVALVQPCPHVFDSAPMRPVSVAIQEGVGMLLGGVSAASPTRMSAFGNLW